MIPGLLLLLASLFAVYRWHYAPTVAAASGLGVLSDMLRIEADNAGRGQRLRAQRLLCLVELLYATGLRVSELVGLKTGAVEK